MRSHLIDNAKQFNDRDQLISYYTQFLVNAVSILYKKCGLASLNAQESHDPLPLKEFVSGLFNNNEACQQQLTHYKLSFAEYEEFLHKLQESSVPKNLNSDGKTEYLTNTPLVAFVFDEARQLLQAKEKQLLFKALRDAFYDLPKVLNVFGIFMDTSSQISNFAPALYFNPSVRESKRLIFDPFVLKGFWDLPFSSNLPMFNRHLLYGRPLWSALFMKDMYLHQLVTLAQVKLIGHQKITDPFSEKSDEVRTSILSFRLCLSLNPMCNLANELVANHMRSLIGVTPDRAGIYTMCPSEPILSFAARTFCLRPDNSFWEMIKLLPWMLQNSQATAGDRGELAVTVLLTAVYDACL